MGSVNLFHKMGSDLIQNFKWSNVVVFSDDFLFGTSTDAYMLKNGSSPIPTHMMLKGKIHVIGRILQFLEVIKHIAG